MTERGTDILLNRGRTPHGVALEDYVAYQWESSGNLLGVRHGTKRDSLTLAWLRDAVLRAGVQPGVLDVGCSYGHHLFMLNAMLGKRQDVAMRGVDLFEGAIRRANAFATEIPGYGNCLFEVADVTAGLPFDDCSFDAINLADVLEHIVDPGATLRELSRVARPGATVVISTPLKNSVFKRAAVAGNRLLRGRLYHAYYAGKDAALDENGQPIMETFAGYDHVSEMTLPQLKEICLEEGFMIEHTELMPVMSGSRWFDSHAVLLATLLLVETVHEKLQRPSWAHSVMLRLRKPGGKS